jgi:hypothetical protein
MYGGMATRKNELELCSINSTCFYELRFVNSQGD